MKLKEEKFQVSTGRSQQIHKGKLGIIIQVELYAQNQSGTGHLEKNTRYSQSKHRIWNMEDVAFISREASPEVLLPALDSTYWEKHSNATERKCGLKKKKKKKALAIRFKYRKEKSEET